MTDADLVAGLRHRYHDPARRGAAADALDRAGALARASGYAGLGDHLCFEATALRRGSSGVKTHVKT